MAVSSRSATLDLEVVDSDRADEQNLKHEVAAVSGALASEGFVEGASEANERAAEYSSMVFNNVLIQGIMTVLIGGILLVLAGVIITDFIEIMPAESGFIEQETLTDPLSTALGLAAIALVVPIVAGVVALLMGSFGGFMGGNGMGSRRR